MGSKRFSKPRHVLRPAECVRQRTVTATVSGYALVVVAFINERKENTMKNIKIFAVAVAVAALTGCISIGSKEPGPQGPPGPKGDSGNTEKVIVVPEKRY
jgi:hypothetical protein